MRFLLLLLIPALSAAAQVPSSGPSANMQQLLQQAETAKKHGDLRTALEDYRKLLAAHPDQLQARIGFASALSAAGQFDAALAEDEQVLQASPDNRDAQFNIATTYFRMGNMSRARMQFESIYAKHPQDIESAIGLGYTYIKLERYDEAAALLAPLASAHSENLDLQYIFAYAQILSGKEDDGIPRMEKVARARRQADAWMITANALFQERQFRAALDDTGQAIAINPQLPGAQTLAGESDYAVGDIDKAIAAFQAALRQNPRDFTANLYLGIIRSNQRDFATARPLLELAVELAPNHPLANLELAKVNALTGHEDEAVKTLEALEKATPNWIEPHIQLSTLYYKVHRPEDGQRERGIVAKLQAQQAGSKKPDSLQPH